MAASMPARAGVVRPSTPSARSRPRGRRPTANSATPMAPMSASDRTGRPARVDARLLRRDEVRRLPLVRPEDVPPPGEFPYLEVAAVGHHPTTPLYSGYYIPASAVLEVRGSDVLVSATRGDMDNLGWDNKPGFLP